MRLATILLCSLITVQLAGQPISVKDLSKSLTHGDKTYGAYCGFAGTHPPTRIAVEQLISERNIEELSSWLRSPNLVVQTYAAEAFIRLSNEEIDFNPEDLDLVEVIKNKEDLVSTCTGCVLEKLSIKECLTQIKPGVVESPSGDVR